jgi:TPP-dependent 2-oxoacid decarboxylase
MAHPSFFIKLIFLIVWLLGSPTRRDQKLQPLLHHTLGDYGIPRQMFEKITAASTTLSDPKTAGSEIDRVLETCLAEQKPVYISLPSDMVYEQIDAPNPSWKPKTTVDSDKDALEEAVNEALALLSKAQNPVVLSDVEVIRYGLQKEFKDLLEKSGLPYATLIMGKTVLNEDHPQFIGLYSGVTSRQYVRDRVENADCVIQFGVLLSDLNSGGKFCVTHNF